MASMRSNNNLRVYEEDPATNTGTLEVLDNGSGMTEEDLEHYVSIGFDKRAVTSNT